MDKNFICEIIKLALVKFDAFICLYVYMYYTSSNCKLNWGIFFVDFQYGNLTPVFNVVSGLKIQRGKIKKPELFPSYNFLLETGKEKERKKLRTMD